MANYLTFVDFPDPDNFLLVLEMAKRCERVDVVLTGRPVDLQYAPSYPPGFFKDFNFDRFAIPVDGESPWFSKDTINDTDTELVFKVNCIRMQRFLEQNNVNMGNVRFFRSNKVDLPLKFKHHMHKQEWRFDLNDEQLKQLSKISWKASKDDMTATVDVDNNIVRSSVNRAKIVDILESYIRDHGFPNIHQLRDLERSYDAFLVAGPFTDVKYALDAGVMVKKIVAMATAIRTGTTFAPGEPRPNLFPDQFNIYADPASAQAVFARSDIPMLLIPTEATKSWGPNKNGFVFTTTAIKSSGKIVEKLFADYYGKDFKDGATFNVFDLVAGRYLLGGTEACTQSVDSVRIDKQGRFVVLCNESKMFDFEDAEVLKPDAKILRSNPKDRIVVGNLTPSDSRIRESSVFETFVKGV